MRVRVAIAALSVLVAGCSGSGDPQPAPKPTPMATTKAATPEPTAAKPTGTPAPEALSAFRCEPKKGKQWEAAGFLANPGKAAVTYQVSVYVGPLDGKPRSVRTKQVANVAPGGSVRFAIDKIPAVGTQCRVQVIRTDAR